MGVGCTEDVINELIAAGAVKLDTDDFGEHMLVMEPTALQPTMTGDIVLWEATPMIRMDLPSIQNCHSKLALYLHCRREWVASCERIPSSMETRGAETV